ncbi:MAG: cytochrome C oxidase subunit IV family protein [Bdellovibrionaceae bacterium]|nr:cytochrome C oxidase subunit IV family protein [Pseudobdellovibrionaceae bacterium]
MRTGTKQFDFGNHLTLLTLLCLTALAYWVADTGTMSPRSSTLVIAAMVLKFSGIAFFFMDLKRAHWFWKAFVAVYVFTLAAIFSSIYI